MAHHPYSVYRCVDGGDGIVIANYASDKSVSLVIFTVDGTHNMQYRTFDSRGIHLVSDGARVLPRSAVMVFPRG